MEALQTLNPTALRRLLESIEQQGQQALALADDPCLDKGTANELRGLARTYRKVWKRVHAQLRKAERAYYAPNELDAIEIRGLTAKAELERIQRDRAWHQAHPFHNHDRQYSEADERNAATVLACLQTKYRTVRDGQASGSAGPLPAD
jgi:hypothetical protein